MKFSVKDLLSKCNQIRRFLRIWSHLPKKSLMENFIFLYSDKFENAQRISNFVSSLSEQNLSELINFNSTWNNRICRFSDDFWEGRS